MVQIQILLTEAAQALSVLKTEHPDIIIDYNGFCLFIHLVSLSHKNSKGNYIRVHTPMHSNILFILSTGYS